MAERINIGILTLFIILFSCEDKIREWDNPYDPRSNKSLWTPDSLDATQTAENIIELTWVRKGRAFDGFIIDRKLGLDEWVFKDSLFDDELTNWADTLNLKTLVGNHVEYQYRIYAYADSNISLKKLVKIKPTLPGPPGSVSIISIDYSHDPSKKLSLEWQKSSEPDFYKYNLYHATTESGSKSDYISIYDANISSIDTSSFDVLSENWFWVEVQDTTGQKTIGNSYNVPIDPPPIPAQFDSILFDNQQFYFSWNMSIEEDILGYSVEQVSNIDTIVISNSVLIERNNTSFEIPVDNDSENYYRIKTEDVWGNSSHSNIRPASSFQKIVKLDTVTENGNDITIMNLGPTMPFLHTINNVKASFPIWIQNGKKIFTFTINNVGHVIDQDGSSIKTISGIRPQDIAFNSDQTEALFVGSDDDIYLAYLNEDELTVRITQNTNNEWYSDPEFISDDNKILYAQRKHFSNNNVGTINLYTMDRDGKNKTQITDAVGEEKFILPRMSPSGDKIIYYFKNVGLYELNYPNEKRGTMVSTLGGDSIIPEITSYFRNIKWSPNGEKAIIWEKKFNSTYNLYVYDKNSIPRIRFFQSNARYAQWNGNDEVIFKYESKKTAMYRKNINSSISVDPVLFYESPWVQLQPRQ